LKLNFLDQMSLYEAMCRIIFKFNQRAIQDLSWSTPKIEMQHEQLAVPNRIVLLRSRDDHQHGATMTFSLDFNHGA